MKSIAILGIGSVNLNTHSNTMHGSIWNCWPENEQESNLLVRDMNSGKYMAISSVSIGSQEYPVGSFMSFHHDQSGRHIEGNWQVTAVVLHTPNGLWQIKQVIGKNAVNFYCFK